MTPFDLLAGISGPRAAHVVEVPPPALFFEARNVTSAYILRESLADEGLRDKTYSQKAGLRFEKKILKELSNLWRGDLRIAPLIRFTDARGSRACIPDALFLPSDGWATIVEIKLQHMPEAWWQLRRLYHPVVRKVFPNRRLRLLEIVKSYDPATPFPEAVSLLSSLADLEKLKDDEMGVLEWKL